MDSQNVTPVEPKPDPLQLIAQYLMKPLDFFRAEKGIGDDLFQYLFYNREKGRKSIKACIDSMTNLTLLGNPGQGKSSLIHNMFLSLKKEDKNVFPIILDWRQIQPKEVEALLADFVEKMGEYFKEIGHPNNLITEHTTVYNSTEHMRLVSQHLQTLKTTVLKKKLVVFLDDLDYSGELYFDILRKHFLNYTVSDKAVVVLSCRQPLYNNISEDDQIRQCYRLQAQIIELNDVDLESLITFRIRSVAKKTREKAFQTKLTGFNRSDKLDSFILKNLKTGGLTDEDLSAQNTLPFNSNFYIKLYQICNGNLRDIESLIPIFLDYEKRDTKPSFNDNFIQAYINAIYNFAEKKSSAAILNFQPNTYLLDLTSQKTQNNKKKLNGNSILQNVLEYFLFNELKNQYFFDTMAQYGISEDQAESALRSLIETPYNLLDPDFIYSINNHHQIDQRYLLNNKGKIYLFEILTTNYYFERMTQYLKLKNLDTNRACPSNQSFYANQQRVTG